MAVSGTLRRYIDHAELGGLCPTVFGVHVLRREGGPPIRLTGRQLTKTTDRNDYFISLWEMRSPGLMLVFSGPEHAPNIQSVQKVADINAAMDALEDYSSQLCADPFTVSCDLTHDSWASALEALRQNAKIEDFRHLVGRTLLQWLERDWAKTP